VPDALINGYSLHWEDAGSGEPLIMVHGAASSGKTLAIHIPDLSKSYRVIIPDLRGMGQSARVDAIPPSAWVDDLKALMAHLDVPSAHLLGSSLGARIVLRTALESPHLARSLILDAAIIANEEAGNRDLNERFDVKNVGPDRAEYFRNLHGDDWATVVVNFFAIRNRPELQQYFDLREGSRRITIPTLIMRGDEPDPTHPLRHSIELHENLADSWLWIRPDSPARLLPSRPAECREVIRTFLAGVAERQATARGAGSAHA